MNHPIVRLNMERYNASAQPQRAEIENLNTKSILANPEDYDMVIEKAEVPLTLMPLDIITAPMRIIVDYPRTLPTHPQLLPGENYFSIGGSYNSPSELLDKINVIIWDRLGPTFGGGSFGLKNTGDRDSRILYKFGDALDRTSLSAGIEIYFEASLHDLVSEIPGLYELMPPGYLGESSRFYRLDWVGFLGGATGVVLKEQTRYLIPKLYGFKSIRVLSNLPIVPFWEFDQSKQAVENSNLITEIILNSETYAEDQKNAIYIPTAFRYSSMTGTQALANFMVYFEIHYRHGENIRLDMGPKEYASLTLAFVKRK